MTSDRPVRVRFAPSPTGRLHIGGARTALFNWAFARRHGGRFLLRVEDTDTERNTDESLHSILNSLRWLGLDWDEGPEVGGEFGPYFQSQRKSLYQQAIDRLLAEGKLYRCFATPEELQELRERQMAAKEDLRYDRRFRDLDPGEAERRAAAGEPFVLRFAVPDGEEIVIPDLIRGEVRFRSEEVEDWVAVRANGMPTYNFVCVVDDAAMEISHVLRGEEHLINTPKQVLLFRALGMEEPLFGHVPLILGADGKKLSKRTGDTALEDYRSKGYPPEALFNFLCLLGFSIDDKTDVFGPEELVSAFDLKRVNKAGAVFDLDKLHWLCGDYIRRTEAAELASRCLPWLQQAGLVEGEPAAELQSWLVDLAAAMRERLQSYQELPEKAAFLFQDGVEPDSKAAKALAGEEARRLVEGMRQKLETLEPFPPENFAAVAKAFAEEHEVGMGKVMKPTRAALTGSLGGPDLGQVLKLLGREQALKRLRQAAART
ncbi:MAG: glutamate--tRNA ligase [Planctomycetota bacterium]|nr:MAG: glutamate--tRNA ligase [Planctomycetota bacterium]